MDMNNDSLTVGNLTGTGGEINGGVSGTRTLTIGQGDSVAGTTKVRSRTAREAPPPSPKPAPAPSHSPAPTPTPEPPTSMSARCSSTAIRPRRCRKRDRRRGCHPWRHRQCRRQHHHRGYRKTAFNLSTAAGSHDGLEITSGKALTLSGASTLTITSSGGASPGLYTLVSGGNKSSVSSRPRRPSRRLASRSSGDRWQ